MTNVRVSTALSGLKDVEISIPEYMCREWSKTGISYYVIILSLK